MCSIAVLIIDSASSVKVSACARWNKTGITVAGNSKSGNSSNQLNGPRGIFIRKSANTLYVADTKNNRIQMFSLDQSSMNGITVASTDGSPQKIFIDEDNGPVIYVSLRNNGRAEKWIQGASSGIQIGSECDLCEGIAVDKEKNVYTTEFLRNRVNKWSPATNSTTVIVDGLNSNNSLDERVFAPLGIYIDKNDDSIYVADSMNHRIQKWSQNAKKGITVAGSYFVNSIEDTGLLEHPNAVLVDEETEMMYITEGAQRRVQRWLINATEGETIAGRPGMFIHVFI